LVESLTSAATTITVELLPNKLPKKAGPPVRVTSTGWPNVAEERCPLCDAVLTFMARTERDGTVPIDRYICRHCGFSFEYDSPSCPKCQMLEVVYVRGLDFGPPTYFCPKCEHTWTVQRQRSSA
jgi:transposase-like protein